MNQRSIKQLRLGFSDYSAEEQEVDSQKHLLSKKKPLLFVMKVDGEWAHLDLNLNYKFYGKDNLFQMFNKVKESHPNHNLKYIINKCLENYLRDMKKRDNKIKERQLNLNFKER